VAGTDEPFTFVNAHTEAYDAGSRDRQRTELVDLLPTDPDRAPRVVLVGDFNATPDEVGMPGDLVDAWTAADNDDAGPEAASCCQGADLTDPRSRLADRIDYIWLRGMTVHSCVRIGADPGDRTEPSSPPGSPHGSGHRLWPSDHAGLVATVSVD
jgi:endonuclease/exonuclease/phosphatase family metal-dependent hydrolase